MTKRSRARWRLCPSAWPLNAHAAVRCERHRWHFGRHRGGNRSWSAAPTTVVQCAAQIGLERQCNAIAIEGFPFCLRHLERAAARAHAAVGDEGVIPSASDG